MTRDNEQRFDFMNPEVPADLPHFEIPLLRATPDNFAPYGTIVTDFMNHPVPITQWPHTGWRPVDVGTGDEGGYMDGIFEFWWEGDVLFGENKAVNDKYILGWSENPETARTDNPDPDRSKLLIWHANHHPDGGQLFYPLGQQAVYRSARLHWRRHETGRLGCFLLRWQLWRVFECRHLARGYNAIGTLGSVLRQTGGSSCPGSGRFPQGIWSPAVYTFSLE